jgi:sugar O-acyltransferase (sialic acid O-acetyltransferase NeuD family)
MAEARHLHRERPLLVIGAFPSRGADIADLVSDIAGAKVDGFVETEDWQKAGGTLEELPVHWIGDLGSFAGTHGAIVAGSIRHRLAVTPRIVEAGMPLATIIHPSASVSSKAEIGDGSVISRGAVVSNRARIGRLVFVNRATSIGHQTAVGDVSELGPGTTIAGQCRIKAQVTIGVGATVIDRRTIGRGAFVCAGSVVTKDIPPGVTAAGNPARVIRRSMPTAEF